MRSAEDYYIISLRRRGPANALDISYSLFGGRAGLSPDIPSPYFYHFEPPR